MLEVKEISLAGHRSQGSMGFLRREAKGRFLLMKYGGAVIPPPVEFFDKMDDRGSRNSYVNLKKRKIAPSDFMKI